MTPPTFRAPLRGLGALAAEAVCWLIVLAILAGTLASLALRLILKHGLRDGPRWLARAWRGGVGS